MRRNKYSAVQQTEDLVFSSAGDLVDLEYTEAAPEVQKNVTIAVDGRGRPLIAPDSWPIWLIILLCKFTHTLGSTHLFETNLPLIIIGFINFALAVAAVSIVAVHVGTLNEILEILNVVNATVGGS